MSEKILSSQIAFSGRAFQLRVDTIEMSDGRTTTREIVEHPNCIAVIAIDSNGDILLVKQFRHSIGKQLLEIPAGGIEISETPESAVVREMREETGYKPKDIKLIGGFYSSPGFCTEYLYLFLATNLEQNPLVAEDTHEIQLVRIPVEEIRNLIVSGEICDSKSIAGLLQYLFLYAH